MDRKVEFRARPFFSRSGSLFKDWARIAPKGITYEDELLLGVLGALVAKIPEDKIDHVAEAVLTKVLPLWKKCRSDEVNSIEARAEIGRINLASMHERASGNAQHCLSAAATMADDAKHITIQYIGGVWAGIVRVTGRLCERTGHNTEGSIAGNS